jgi:hypothetical protein
METYRRVIIWVTMAEAQLTELDSVSHRSVSVRQVLTVSLVTASIAYIVLFLVAAALRASYPLQLEWLECGALDTVGRVLHGQPIYVRPTHFFVPFLYTPFYYFVGAVACRVAGFDFSALRWLSTLCTVACFALQFAMASRLANSRLAGIVAAGYFAALYATTGWWFDLARVDMLYVALILGGIYLSWTRRPIFAALVFALAFQTKQTAILIAICVLAHEYRHPRRLLHGLLAFFAFAGASTLAFIHLYGPWFLYYTRYIPSHHPLELRGVPYFFGRDLLYPSLIAIAIVAMCGRLATQRARNDRTLQRTEAEKNHEFPSADYRFILATILGLSVSCFLGRIHTGASVNIALPLDAWLAILFGASVVIMLRWTSETNSPVSQRRGLLILGAALLQFVALARSPMRYIPSPAAKAEAAGELAQIARTPGNLYSLVNAADLAVVGKQSYANTAAVFDVLRAGQDETSKQLQQDMQQSFARHDYAAVLSNAPLDAPGSTAMDAPADLARYYRAGGPPLVARPASPDAFTADRTHPFPRYLSPAKSQ